MILIHVYSFLIIFYYQSKINKIVDLCTQEQSKFMHKLLQYKLRCSSSIDRKKISKQTIFGKNVVPNIAKNNS